ncbi:MAG TPA: hypothetical protein VM779_06200, partial [Thermoanaerobaculia bacterium]|nr:hypothetical protein [Thermoanaerobaculia bacterium]
RMTVPPSYSPAPPQVPFSTQAPPVVTWFKVYAGIMCLLYLLVIAGGVFFLLIPATEEEAWIMGLVFFAIGLPLLAVFAASLFLPPKPWVWIYDIVLICLGFTSCLTLPFCIALLIFWLKPETKVYFGRRP